MTRIVPKVPLKIVPLPLTADLDHISLQSACALAGVYPHDGWADLVVHQVQLAPAMRIAIAHNARRPNLQVRVTTDTTLGRADWKVKTGGVIVTSLWTNKTE